MEATVRCCGRVQLPSSELWGFLGEAHGSSAQCLGRPQTTVVTVHQRSTATDRDLRGPGGMSRDSYLRGWTRVDVLPVVCKQGVRGSSPLSSTGQRHNSNSRIGSTAAARGPGADADKRGHHSQNVQVWRSRIAGGQWRRWRSGRAAAIATSRGSCCPGTGAVAAFRSAGAGAYGVMFWLMWKRLPGS